MSSKCPTDELVEVVGQIPIHSHTRVLGVDIEVPQLQHHCEIHGENYPLAGHGKVKISAVGSDARIGARDRRYIAAWARRNLFDGAKPR